jgi:acyl-CoA synthetase (NDP forming)
MVDALPHQKDAPRSAVARLLNPGAIAIAGISDKPGALATAVLDNLERFSFSGDIHLVHPNRSEFRGMRCVPQISDLPYGVDCVVLAIPASSIVEAVSACAAHGVGGIVIFSAGFAEAGPEGRAIQDKIATIALASGMAIEGPNCLGFVNYADGVALTFSVTDPQTLTEPGIAVVSQSGAMAAVMRAAVQSHGLEISLSVSTGNEATHGIEDFLEHILADTSSRAIAMVVEHIRDPQRFLRLARQARERGIPLIMLHPGSSSAARKSAQTHTGALAGDYEAMRTCVERAGILVADTLEELIDLADCVMRCVRPCAGGVAILSESGAYKALALDYCETLGISLPQPRGDAEAALNAIAPGLVVASNPLDLTAQALVDPALYALALDNLMVHPDCGSLLVTIILSNSKLATRKMPPVIDAMRRWSKSRTVLFAMLGDDSPIPDDIVRAVRAEGIPFFRSPERALRTLARFVSWAELPLADAEPIPAVPSKRLLAGIMPEHAAKRILEEAGLPMPRRRLVTDVESAILAARAIGFPVALKIQSATLSHKSDVGGVILGLKDGDSLREGWARLQDNIAAAAPNTKLDGVLVEAMSQPGLELILGARNDPDWGPVLAVGLGGVFAEALKDVQLMPADVSIVEIRGALRRLKGNALLGPFRGKPARDVDAIALAVAKLGAFMRAHPEVTEVDINPLVAFGEREGVLALDALISCSA